MKHCGCNIVGHSRKDMSLLLERSTSFDQSTSIFKVEFWNFRSRGDSHCFPVFRWKTARNLRNILTSWWASMPLAAVGPTWDDLQLSTRSTWDGAAPWATKDQWSMNLAMVPGLKNWKMWFDDGWWLKINSSRFATSSARTQGIGPERKEAAYLAQPKPTGVKLGRPWTWA